MCNPPKTKSLTLIGLLLLGALIVSITSTVASWYIGPNGRYEVYVVRKDL